MAISYSPSKKVSITTVAKASDVEQRRLLQRRSQRRHQIKPPLTQDECLAELRKHVEKAPIPPIQKKTLTNITKASTDIHKTDLAKCVTHIFFDFLPACSARATLGLPFCNVRPFGGSERPLRQGAAEGNCRHDGPKTGKREGRGKSWIYPRIGVSWVD